MRKGFNKYFILVIVPILFTSCAGNKNTTLIRDEFVKSRLVGTWKTNEIYEKVHETIQFSDNNTFLDTLFRKVPGLDDSFYAKYVATGKYNIEDREIFFSDVNFLYYNDLRNPLAENAVELFDPRKPNLDDEYIYFGRTVTLNRKTEGTGIEGKWEIIHWASTMESNSDEKFKGGLVKDSYEFIPDSGMCHYKRNYLFKTSLPDIDKWYKYRTRKSYLEIEPIMYVWYSINGDEMNIWGSSEYMLYEKIN